jgi:hypothetical protein
MHGAMLAGIGMAVARVLRRQIEAGQGIAEPVAARGEVARLCGEGHIIDSPD